MQLVREQVTSPFAPQGNNPSAPSFFILSRFYEKMQHKLLELDKASRAFVAMERELEHFLTRYYTRILPLCETLEALRHGLPLRLAVRMRSSVPLKPAEIIHTNDVLRQQLKSLYRTLMKAHHPDIAAAHTKRRPISDIIDAYEEHRLGTLWRYRIEQECILHPDRANAAHYLKEQYIKIEALLHEVRTKTAELSMSPAWELKERAAEAGLRGTDLVHATAHRIETYIAALHKNFYPCDKMHCIV